MERAGEVKTMADARRVLGEPVSVTRGASGRTVWCWMFTKAGMLTKDLCKTLHIAFDADGKVVKVGRSGNR